MARWPFNLALGLVLVAALVWVGTGSAATYDACPDPAGYTVGSDAEATALACVAQAERIEQLDADVNAGAASSSSSDAVVSLAADDASRLQLIWTGVWFVGGVSFGVWAFRRLGAEAARWGAGA